MIADVLIIGAGQAGLASAYWARRAGLETLLLDAAGQPGGSWPRYSPRLELLSPRRFSRLPGAQVPGEPSGYPVKEEITESLSRYEEALDAPVERGFPVSTVEKTGTGFRAWAEDGRSFAGRALICASGIFAGPIQPDLPGFKRFSGRVEQGAVLRQPERFAGQRVLILGAGNTAMHAARRLNGHAEVWLTSRHKPLLLPRRILGVDLCRWKHLLLIDHAPVALLGRPAGRAHAVDPGPFRKMLKSNEIHWTSLPESFDEQGARWQGGKHLRFDAVIVALGFRPRMPYLRRLNALGPAEEPLLRGGLSRRVPGLAFAGLPGQLTPASGTLRGSGPDARRVVKKLRTQLNRPQRGSSSGS